MALTIKTTTNTKDPAEFISNSIINKLKAGKRVLFFVTGGSSIAVCVEVSKILKNHPLDNLTVLLTDERYGPVGHPDSNWAKLMSNGLDLPFARLFPVLTGEPHKTVTENYNKILTEELASAEYKIGLFGVGVDGHTAGILPGSVAVNNNDFVCGYETGTFSRITVTPKTIEKLDEAVVWMQGTDKWQVVKDLDEKNIELIKQPAQILKKVPLLTIFTDYNKN
ncbi:MAG TPA: 6-phosphogluconolactonase [Candidatus Paceibacterota bacterium]|nr:6-phosphogluconolactonase [Candidatus Paceibacterota bacterium]